MNLKMLVIATAGMIFFPIGALAALKTADDATQLVVNWLNRNPRPLGAPLGQRLKEVETYTNQKGEAMYHIVYLNPSGFVIVPADDLVEPIIAFASQGRFDPSVNNPLGALVSGDVPTRVAHARAMTVAALSGHYLKARNKWLAIKHISDANTNAATSPTDISIVSDLRIAPLVQTTWNQTTANNGMACYNYYTPPYAAGSSSNYFCGCVGTALAQLLRYFQYPTAGVGTNSFTIAINNTNATAHLLGGNGIGGPYCWTNMPLIPNNPSVGQCQAIGALTHDCGVALPSDFGPGGTGAGDDGQYTALTQTFMYSNAIWGENFDSSTFKQPILGVVNANLDARLPVSFGIAGHEVVCDGYGYSLSTLYHHINMGWGGAGNAWYALPFIDSDASTNIYDCTYNIFTNGTGEIISGRIMSGNVPLPNINITAIRKGGGIYTARTDTNGIYALVAIPSASQYTLTATGTNFAPLSTNVTTGTSSSFNLPGGDLWGIDFKLIPTIGPPMIPIEPIPQLLNVANPPALFNITALSFNALSYQWQCISSQNPMWTNLSDGPTYSGSLSANLSVNILNESLIGNQFRCIVTNSSGCATSNPASLIVVGLSPNCAVPALTGLTAWWTGNATVNDQVSTNNGIMQTGATYVLGEQGYAFNFDGLAGGVDFGNQIGNFGTNDFTIDFWLNTTSSVSYAAVLSKRDSYGHGNFWNIISAAGYVVIELDQDSSGDNYMNLQAGSKPVNDGLYHHVAVARQANKATVYLDGFLAASTATTGITVISNNAECLAGFRSASDYWAGTLDDIRIYNRALSLAEIQAIYQAGTNGMCVPSSVPSFLGTQPLNQTNMVGGTACFSALAECAAAFTYQWRRNSQPVSQATDSKYVLTPIRLADAGAYDVVASSPCGSTSSKVAILTVIPSPNTNCAVSAPAGLVSWWGGENNPNDRVGTNNAVLQGGICYVAGKVGNAFCFDGTNGSINFGNQIGNFGTNDFTIDFWLKTQATQQESLFSMRVACCYASFWNIFVNGGFIQCEFSQDASGSIYQNFTETQKVVNDGQFHHIAFTRSNILASIYIDGLVAASSIAPGVAMLSDNVPCYAGISPCPLTPYSGILDEIQMYNRALSASEIAAIYLAGTNGMCAPTPLMFTGPPIYSRTIGVVLDSTLRSSQNYHIQANSNLASSNWITLANFIAGTTPIFHFTNKPNTNTSQQFYRIVSP